eukprot:3837668-Ditylum_brightwellii.AAC.1
MGSDVFYACVSPYPAVNFNNTKTVCYIGPAHRNNRYHCMLGQMDEGILQTQDGLPVYGLKIYGVPTGDADYMKKALSMKATKIRSELKWIETRLDPFFFPEPQLPVR